MENIKIGKARYAKQTYGFDDISLVPSNTIIDPDDVDISLKIRNIKLKIPIFASAMDAVVDPSFAIEMEKLGGIAVLNLEGIQTRYENPQNALQEIVTTEQKDIVSVIQKIYSQPIKEDLIEKRVSEIKKHNVPAVVSVTPQSAEKLAPLAISCGCDMLVIQSTVTTAKYISSRSKILDLKKFCKKFDIPIILGNCVSYDAAIDLMSCGCEGVLVGIGPGAACTTRRVLGIGVPQVSAICDVSYAREVFYKKNKRYVTVIADGGMQTGGDIAKAIASGADAVMLGSCLAQAKESPGGGYHWGMATPHPGLPRGTRIYVGQKASLKEILFGPAKTDDGTMNLVSALRQAMGLCGAKNIREMQKAQIIIAPSISSEGKMLQREQKVGMGK